MDEGSPVVALTYTLVTQQGSGLRVAFPCFLVILVILYLTFLEKKHGTPQSQFSKGTVFIGFFFGAPGQFEGV